MKKLIALTLMVVCLAGFSLGCGDKKPAPPAPSGNTSVPADPATPADAPAETPADPAPAPPIE